MTSNSDQKVEEQIQNRTVRSKSVDEQKRSSGSNWTLKKEASNNRKNKTNNTHAQKDKQSVNRSFIKNSKVTSSRYVCQLQSQSRPERVSKVKVVFDNELVLQNLIKAQIEYLFSDYHLTNDTYLLARMQDNAQHWLSIDELCHNQKIRCLTNKKERILEALKESKYLQLSPQNDRVRRPDFTLPKLKPNRDLRRTVFLYGIAPNKREHEIRKLLSQYGHIKRIHFEPESDSNAYHHMHRHHHDHAHAHAHARGERQEFADNDDEAPNKAVAQLIMKKKFLFPSRYACAQSDHTDHGTGTGSDTDCSHNANNDRIHIMNELYAHPVTNPNGDAHDFSHLKTCFVVFESQSQATKCVKARVRAVDGMRCIHKYDYNKVAKKFRTAQMKGEKLTFTPPNIHNNMQRYKYNNNNNNNNNNANNSRQYQSYRNDKNNRYQTRNYTQRRSQTPTNFKAPNNSVSSTTFYNAGIGRKNRMNEEPNHTQHRLGRRADRNSHENCTESNNNKYSYHHMHAQRHHHHHSVNSSTSPHRSPHRSVGNQSTNSDQQPILYSMNRKRATVRSATPNMKSNGAIVPPPHLHSVHSAAQNIVFDDDDHKQLQRSQSVQPANKPNKPNAPQLYHPMPINPIIPIKQEAAALQAAGYQHELYYLPIDDANLNSIIDDSITTNFYDPLIAYDVYFGVDQHGHNLQAQSYTSTSSAAVTRSAPYGPRSVPSNQQLQYQPEQWQLDKLEKFKAAKANANKQSKVVTALSVLSSSNN